MNESIVNDKHKKYLKATGVACLLIAVIGISLAVIFATLCLVLNRIAVNKYKQAQPVMLDGDGIA